MDYRKPTKGFQRYMRAFQETGGPPVTGPDGCYGLLNQLLGCTDIMPSWLIDELREEEGLAEESVTYHDAAVDMLTEHFIEDDDWPQSGVRLLYPVFVKVCEVNGTEATQQGFSAWLATMLTEDDVTDAMEYWTPM